MIISLSLQYIIITVTGLLLNQEGLKQLRKLSPFRQIRFFCHKPKSKTGYPEDKRLHFTTSNNTIGGKVVDYMLGSSGSTPPPACGSYDLLHGDESRLGGDCGGWDGGRWGEASLYTNPFSRNYFHFTAGYECDDYQQSYNFRSAGTWEFYVR